ncbi:hypothetical protein YC2023_108160 [Brassica napus]
MEELLSRWSKFKIQSVHGDLKKPRERGASKEPYLMTKTARRSYSKAEHHHYTSRRNISYYKSEAGRELSRTGSKHDWIEARRENPKLGKNPNFGITKFFEEAGGSGNIFKGYQTSSRIRMGAEKYSGLIAGQKFTRRVEIAQRNREARGGLIRRDKNVVATV